MGKNNSAGRKLVDSFRELHRKRSPDEASYNDWRGTLKGSRIDYILHTGRQSLLPLIMETVQEVFPNLAPGRHRRDGEHLKVCVAKGAALYGWMRDKLGNPEARVHFLSEGRRLPHSYGVEKFAKSFDQLFADVEAKRDQLVAA